MKKFMICLFVMLCFLLGNTLTVYADGGGRTGRSVSSTISKIDRQTVSAEQNSFPRVSIIYTTNLTQTVLPTPAPIPTLRVDQTNEQCVLANSRVGTAVVVNSSENINQCLWTVSSP